MRLRIVAKHTELSESLKQFAEEKTSKLEKYFEGATQAQLILCPDFVGRRGSGDQKVPDAGSDDAEPAERPEDSQEATGHVASAELIVTVPGEKKPLVAHARGENFRAAIDIVLNKMERQLSKHKQKRRERRPQRGSH